MTCEAGGADSKIFCHYLRFYPDGAVIGVTTSGSPNEIKRWFRRPYDNKGTYAVKGSHISFSLISNEGRVDYKDSIHGSKLHLRWHSHINGNKDAQIYNWVRPRRR